VLLPLRADAALCLQVEIDGVSQLCKMLDARCNPPPPPPCLNAALPAVKTSPLQPASLQPPATITSRLYSPLPHVLIHRSFAQVCSCISALPDPAPLLAAAAAALSEAQAAAAAAAAAAATTISQLRAQNSDLQSGVAAAEAKCTCAEAKAAAAALELAQAVGKAQNLKVHAACR